MTRLSSASPTSCLTFQAILRLGKHNMYIFTPVTHTHTHTHTQRDIENWHLLNLHDFSTCCEIYAVISTARLMEMEMKVEMER